jgi:hypothetical protein
MGGQRRQVIGPIVAALVCTLGFFAPAFIDGEDAQRIGGILVGASAMGLYLRWRRTR